MKYEKYESVLVSSNGFEFLFVSVGPKGQIQKAIQFQETSNPQIYNLAFGDLLPDGSIDDQVENNNKDRNKIPATVAAVVYEFTANNIEKMVFFKGSSDVRTRLYQIAITLNLKELSNDFTIFGLYREDDGYKAENFTKGKNYSAFIVKRKIF